MVKFRMRTKLIKFSRETRNGSQYLFTSPQQQIWHKSDTSYEGKCKNCIYSLCYNGTGTTQNHSLLVQWRGAQQDLQSPRSKYICFIVVVLFCMKTNKNLIPDLQITIRIMPVLYHYFEVCF